MPERAARVFDLRNRPTPAEKPDPAAVRHAEVVRLLEGLTRAIESLAAVADIHPVFHVTIPGDDRPMKIAKQADGSYRAERIGEKG